MTDSRLKMDLIRKQACFSQFTDQEVDELSDLLTDATFSAGQTIVNEGETVDSVYLIISGTAEVREIISVDRPNETKHTAILNPGESIGLNETGFFSLTGLRTASVIAQTDMRLFRLSVAAFHGFSLSHTHVTEVMHKHAAQYLTLK